MIPIVYHTLGGFFKNGIECAVFEDFSGFLKKLAQKLNKNRFRRPVSEIFDTKKMTLLNRSESGLEFFRGSQNFWRGHPYQNQKGNCPRKTLHPPLLIFLEVEMVENNNAQKS